MTRWINAYLQNASNNLQNASNDIQSKIIKKYEWTENRNRKRESMFDFDGIISQKLGGNLRRQIIDPDSGLLNFWASFRQPSRPCRRKC